ncbi:hypothetical protein QNO08_17125 [Arthrobacter sp. zg-Y820]|uniref:hypothetical protein n=1 Tax=unclassified Arthrobacter TaxID=235627 RepID=UPI001E42276D|nr:MULTISPECIES: hypothetical protein [unclassified Arthrobacter]MCC9197360.1 hypothetical protein [Arthrobacter sp. zg-Y820]MDK1280226.1 hypothetical protein [Arthrobacter sp. zg.Y820]WIB09517.1 hypothetical protein QNO08_17125 [Arthrobacter sp. zg-Y820]
MILRSACATVVAHVVPGQLLVLTPTTQVGSTWDLLAQLLESRRRPGFEIDVAFRPVRSTPEWMTSARRRFPARQSATPPPAASGQSGVGRSRYGPIQNAGLSAYDVDSYVFS